MALRLPSAPAPPYARPRSQPIRSLERIGQQDPGQFAPWPFAPGQFSPWPFRFVAISFTGTFDVWLFRSRRWLGLCQYADIDIGLAPLERTFPGHFAPKNESSAERDGQGAKGPGANWPGWPGSEKAVNVAGHTAVRGRSLIIDNWAFGQQAAA